MRNLLYRARELSFAENCAVDPPLLRPRVALNEAANSRSRKRTVIRHLTETFNGFNGAANSRSRKRMCVYYKKREYTCFNGAANCRSRKRAVCLGEESAFHASMGPRT